MISVWRRTMRIVVLCSAAPLFGAAVDASASSPAPDNASHATYSASTSRGEYRSTVTVSNVGGLSSRSPTVAPAAPSGALIHCNKGYSFPDSNGTYTIQHACGGTTAPWGFKISSSLCSIAISPVSEQGMDWTRNGVRQPRQAPHPVVPCGYQFHGTYSPARDFDKISYSDTMTFRVSVGGSTGTATLNIYGSFTLLNSTCSPTSC